MRLGRSAWTYGVAVAAYACSSGGSGAGTAAMDGAGDSSGAAAPSAGFEGTAGGAGGAGARAPTGGDPTAAPSSDFGGTNSAAPNECVAAAAQYVSAACAECACARGSCRSRVAACGPLCWGLLACVEEDCSGDTADAQCILATCDLSDSEAASRAGSCLSRCSTECSDDLSAIARPPDGGSPPPDGGSSGAGTCPGEAISLTATAPAANVSGTTVGLGDDYESYCAKDGTGGSETVYAITFEQAGTLQVDVSGTSGAFDAVLYVESTCGAESTTVACRDHDGLSEELALPVDGPGTLYVVVESRSGGEGTFTADFSIAPAACGDGAVNPGEQCDFGDVAPGDGCDASCRFEPPSDASDACPGEVDTLIAGTPTTINAFTVGYSDGYDAPCGAEIGAPDRVFAFNPQANGTLTASLSSSFDGVLSLYETCNVPNLFDLRLCSDAPRASANESLSVDVVGGAQYFIVVDGYRTGSMGTFQLTVELTP